MKHLVNNELPKGDYRIVCTKCGRVFVQAHGGLTQGGLASMRFSEKCNECGGNIVLETNPN